MCVCVCVCVCLSFPQRDIVNASKLQLSFAAKGNCLLEMCDHAYKYALIKQADIFQLIKLVEYLLFDTFTS